MWESSCTLSSYFKHDKDKCPASLLGFEPWSHVSRTPSTHASTDFLHSNTKPALNIIKRVVSLPFEGWGEWFGVISYWAILQSAKHTCILCGFTQAQVVLCYLQTREHQNKLQVMRAFAQILPVCPLKDVSSVQFSCSSLRMVTWPEWSPINTWRVSTSNLSCNR